MDTALDHLRAALSAMSTTRDQLAADLRNAENQITIVQRTIDELSDESPRSNAAASPYEGPSIRDIAREIASAGHTFSLADVVDASRAAGNESKYASISSILSRMVNEGELRKGAKRGSFALAANAESPEAPENDKDPAEAGSSLVAVPHQKEGGGADDGDLDHHRHSAVAGGM